MDELNLNVFDYGARNYDAAIGRWFNHDPLSEVAYDLTLYRYGLNNPISFVDPTGMLETQYKDEDGLTLLNTKDGSDDVITVSNDKRKDFRDYNASYQSGNKSLYDSQEWNENMKADLLGFSTTNEMNATLGGFTTQWSRQNAINYLQNPTISNALAMSASESLSQWTDIYKLTAAASIWVGSIPGRSSIKEEVSAARSVYVPLDELGQNLKVTKTKAGNIKIDGEVRGRSHTQLRIDATGNYSQRNTFDAKGRRRSDTHFTTHGEANKSNPHKHTYYRNGRRSSGR